MEYEGREQRDIEDGNSSSRDERGGRVSST